MVSHKASPSSWKWAPSNAFLPARNLLNTPILIGSVLWRARIQRHFKRCQYRPKTMRLREVCRVNVLHVFIGQTTNAAWRIILLSAHRLKFRQQSTHRWELPLQEPRISSKNRRHVFVPGISNISSTSQSTEICNIVDLLSEVRTSLSKNNDRHLSI